jgi:hypothetical protein
LQSDFEVAKADEFTKAWFYAAAQLFFEPLPSSTPHGVEATWHRALMCPIQPMTA